MPDAVLLRTEGLTRAYGSLIAVAGVDVSVKRGELRSIIGPNGAGKTTFFRLISGEEMARLFNLATEGVKARLAFHICFGNRFGRSRFHRTYAPYFPGVLKARAEQFVLEFTSRELSELDLWKRYGEGRELGAGVVDVKGFSQDTPEEVAGRIRRVLQVCPAERLTVNPDCGFGWSPRYMCNQKLTALAAGAALVRKELAGQR